MNRYVTTTQHGVRLHVRNNKQNVRIPKHYEILLDVMSWMSDQLNLFDCRISCSVITYPTDDYFGDMIHEQQGYKININKLNNIRTQVHTLAHEMAHVSQVETGLLKIYSNGACKWRGRRYKILDSHGHLHSHAGKTYDMLTQPWEVDAEEKCRYLVNKLPITMFCP